MIKKSDELTFSLVKVKLSPNCNGLVVDYEIIERDESTTYQNDFHVECAMDVHTDLKNAMRKLKPALMSIYGFNAIPGLIFEDYFDANKTQKELVEIIYQGIEDKIAVSGLSLSGMNKNKGIVINGTFMTDEGSIIKINSHRLRFDSRQYEFEIDIKGCVEEIEKEVYLYLFENKRIQVDLFDFTSQCETIEQKKRAL